MNIFEKIKLRQEQELRKMPRATHYVNYDYGNDKSSGTIDEPLLTYREANKRSRRGIDFIIIMKSSKTEEEIRTIAGM